MGAALATLIGLGSRNIWVYLRAKKLYNMGLDLEKTALLFLIGAAASLGTLLGPEDLILSICLDTALMLAVFMSFILLPILPKEYRSMAIQIIKNPWRYNSILKAIQA